MRNFEFVCDCGATRFIDTDNLSYRAKFIPEQEYDEFSQTIDDAIEKSGDTPADKDRACMKWREHSLLYIWQCFACGCLYIEDSGGSRHRFDPSSPTVPKRLFERRRRDL